MNPYRKSITVDGVECDYSIAVRFIDASCTIDGITHHMRFFDGRSRQVGADGITPVDIDNYIRQYIAADDILGHVKINGSKVLFNRIS